MFSGAPTAAARTVGSAGSTYISPITGPVAYGGLKLSERTADYMRSPEAAQLREALTDNPMLGAMSPDDAFGAAIINEANKTKEKKEKTTQEQKDNMSAYVPRSNAKAEDVIAAWKKPTDKNGLKDIVKHAPSPNEARRAAEGMGVKAEDFDSIYKRVLGDLSKGNADIIKSIRELTEEQVGEAKNIKAEGGRKALMNFGFNMAAEASRPGQPGNKGFAGLLRSAAAASPSYAASLADTDKMARESQRLANQMQVEMVKYQVALDKNDKSTAVQAAHNIMSTKIQQQQVNNAYEHSKAMEKLEGQKIGMMGQRYAAMQGNNSFKIANLNAKAIEMGKRQADSDYKNNINLMTDKNMTPAKLAKQYSEQYYAQLLRSMASPLMPLEE
jgi:hypothetical protein